ncbi:MAG: hypothetical protein GVY14_11055 [Spirochaetes bacterium]|nr:hypothetical protein [Spirochaetota bacterium]
MTAQEYQVFGDVEGVTTYHYLEDADSAHRLTGAARIRADHRLTFDRAELVADTEIELRSPASSDPEAGPRSFSAGTTGGGSAPDYGEGELDYFVDEAYLTLFPLNPVTASAGKQRVNWGTGYTFTPTDTLHPRSATGRDEGFRGASVTWTPTANLTLAAHVSADDAFDDPEGAAQNGMRYAVYGSAFLGNAEVFVSGVYGPGSTLRPGAGVSAEVLGLVLAAEGAVELRSPVAYPEGSGANARFETRDAGTPAPLGLVAVEYNAANDILDFATITEYLYAGTGYTTGEAEKIYDAVAAARGKTPDAEANAWLQALGTLDPQEAPFFLGRHYVGQTLTLGIAGYVELESGLVVNAADLSYEAEQTVRVTALQGVDFFTTARWYGGGADSELGAFPDGVTPPGRVQVELGSVVHF